MSLHRGLVIVCAAVCVVGGAIWLLSPARPAPRTLPPAPSAAITRPAESAPATPSAVASAVPGDPFTALPVTASELHAAMQVAQRFVAAYGTYRWDEDPRAYLSRLEPMAGHELLQGIGGLAGAPGVLGDRRATGQNAVADATVTQVRSLTVSSVTFVVASRQRLSTSTGVSKDTTRFLAVQVSKTNGTWRVDSLEPAVLTDGDFR